MYGRWNWRGLGAYAVGFVSMIPFFHTELYTGAIGRSLGYDIAMLVGLPVAGLFYLMVCRTMNVAEDRSFAFSADLGLESDA